MNPAEKQSYLESLSLKEIDSKEKLYSIGWEAEQYLYWNTFEESPEGLNSYWMLDRLLTQIYKDKQMIDENVDTHFDPVEETIAREEFHENAVMESSTEDSFPVTEKAEEKPAKKTAVKKEKVVKESTKKTDSKKTAPKKEVAVKKEKVVKEPKAVKPAKIERPRSNGYTRPQAGTLVGMIWDKCDKDAKTKAGVERAKVIEWAEKELGVAHNTAATQFNRWKIFNFGSNAQ